MAMISMSEAVQRTGLARYSLVRFEYRGLLQFERINGRVFIEEEELMESPIFTLGRAGRLIGRSWWTMQRWQREGILRVYYEPFPHSRARVSLNEIYRAEAEKRSRKRAKND